jgi:hypothetical protein
MPAGTKRLPFVEVVMERTTLKKILVATSVIISTAAYGLYRYREQRIDNLYAEAAGIPPAFHGTKEAQAAVRTLATYGGDRTTGMLLNIALGRTPFTWPDVQRDAINALTSRRDPSISTALAIVLQPHQPLPTRQAAAQALQSLPCTPECVRAILQYLERVWRGEPNYEDRTSYPPGLSEGVKADLAKDQEALYQALYRVLKREPKLTLGILVQVYGLGTDSCSKFALDVISRMQFAEACPAVLQSVQLLKQSSPESFLAPRLEIEAALRSLKCR